MTSKQEFRENFKTKFVLSLQQNKSVIKVLKKHKTNEDELSNIVEQLDNEIYKWCINHLDKKMINNPKEHSTLPIIYFNKFLQIYSNLLPNKYIKNDYLLDKIVSKEIPINSICNLKPEQIYPKAWEELLEKKRKIDKIKYSIKDEATTDEYVCRRCKNNKCTYYQRQTRSADEAMTTFITCTICQNKWKI
jgi:DNA-directed RNA polymerase subunit M/transcription elongation factor TFIIS